MNSERKKRGSDVCSDVLRNGISGVIERDEIESIFWIRKKLKVDEKW